MNISPATLEQQYHRAAAAWPFLHDIERRYQLPPFLLFAVGSRETNLTDELGDGGHGHGAFQLDDRSHTIPDPFPVELQAETAAQMLKANAAVFGGNWTAAVCAYNAGVGAVTNALRYGQDPNTRTAGGDYGTDVEARRLHLAATIVQEDHDMAPAPTTKMAVLTNPNGPGVYELQADGGIVTRDGATFPDGMPPYVAMANDGNTYYFPAANGAMNYLGLPDDDRKGDRYFTDFSWTGGR